ncbi:MAG TPA: hypothetical protein VGN70_09700 [Gammaproteobacteria bacterium]|jgi:hypothetical protein
MNSGKPHRDHRLMLHDAVVCCRLCVPPQQVDIPARIFYRLRDGDAVSCPNGHLGTLLDYKHAAGRIGTAYGPFIRYDHAADWSAGQVADDI